MISCEEAAIICNKTQYKEASFIEKIKLKVHIVICAACSKYVRKNTKLTELCAKAPLHGLSENEKNTLRKRLSEHL